MITTEEMSNGTDERASVSTRGDVMVVDDQPANLRLMEDMLRREGYGVRSFPRGRLALGAAGQRPPDLILLDINMPEMDGFEMCARLKADKKLASIPVIFLTALNETEDKVKAFRMGGMDYITKPFQVEEVQARVETHLSLERARRSERELLENTLTAAVRALADLIHQTGPALAARAKAILSLVVHLTATMGLDEPWQYELAATLCLIGCVALPADAFERAYSGQPLASDEEMFRAHPENGARLIARIPRLEIVSEMIRLQQTASRDSKPGNAATVGACMLRMAMEVDRCAVSGLSFQTALSRVKANPNGFPPEMIEALKSYAPPRVVFERKALQVRDLEVSMIAEEDILTEADKFMILGKGNVLSATALEKIRNFDKTRGIHQPIRVQVPREVRFSMPDPGCSRSH